MNGKRKSYMHMEHKKQG